MQEEFASTFQNDPLMVDEANFSKSDLLVRMSHEMRTPLSAILGFAQLMESGSPAPTTAQKRSIERILEAGWYLEKLINMTRDLALIESGTLPLSLESVPLAAVMLDVAGMIESQARMRGVRVTFPCFETPCRVSADRIRLQEVLGSFLCAAIEDTEVGGAVVVDCETHGSEWIRIVIRDVGEGSSVERLTRRFQRLDATGIGLQLAKHLVELMGGTIREEGIDLKRMLGNSRPQIAVHSPDNPAHQSR